MLSSQLCLALPGFLYHSLTSVRLNYAKHGPYFCTIWVLRTSLAYICDICNEFILNTVSGIMANSSVSLWLDDIQTWNQFPLDCSPWKQTKPFLLSLLAYRYGFCVVLRLLHGFTMCVMLEPRYFFKLFVWEFSFLCALMVIYCRYKLPSMFHLNPSGCWRQLMWNTGMYCLGNPVIFKNSAFRNV